MFDGRDVIYLFDGSFEGLLSCVFVSFLRRELPCAVVSEETEQLCFSEILRVETSRERAERVLRAIPKKISPEAEELVKKVFLSCETGKYLLILEFLQKGFHYGSKILEMLADDTVNAMNRAALFCGNEAQKMLEFIRFSDYGGYLAAVIEPKNKVIPLLAEHFTDRLPNENFLIFDKSHGMALIYYNRKAEIAENIEFELPCATAEEQRYRELWRGFYDAVAIKERYNPRCRMNFMPKRYWAHMTEMCRDEDCQLEKIPNNFQKKLT
ncbi:MAG: TIGR03915 family putative DNA repair protein [Ruminococcus sp.]|nr:TIGR03915 family putative DNA repair protein [Ruminococcus sp.]MCM1381979.1 TIGR03915 family putative DNA repair protein [Muribaculaceae bacterium]MCM1478422.1 TIGR03915 family putative DNA repair protein [Muribaculaceae bacterium]